MDKKNTLILTLGAFFTYLVIKLAKDSYRIKARDFYKLAKLGQIANPLRIKTYVSSPFGYRTFNGVRQLHNGIDLPAPTGTPIFTPLSGTVTNNFYNSRGGNQIIISSGDVTMGYAHLNKRSPLAVGTLVKKGDIIGEVGNTGISTGAHLHYTIRVNGELINPAEIIYDSQTVYR